ncbi:MAG: metallophosphoesterase family protein [Chloroflexota bacterium]
MKIGVISDIHGDIRALKDVLEKLEEIGVRRVICAGDLVDRGIYGESVVALIQQRRIATVRGNHDNSPFEPQHLSDSTMVWLSKLPRSRRYMWHGLTLCVSHGTPQDFWRGVYPSSDHRVHLDAIEEARTDILIVGHTHQPMITNIHDGKHWIFNPGALHDDGRGAAFAVMQLPQEDGDLFAFDVYEVGTWQQIEPAYVEIPLPDEDMESDSA